MITCAVALAGLAACGLWPRPGFTLAPDPARNVLLITIDTLRADALSAYGGPAHTPNIDALAAHGARFTFAHAHAVVTLPSHTSILTGQFPYQHGMRDNSGFRVRPGTATLATRLKGLGFATAAFVGGFPVTKRFGLTPGFDIYDDQMPETKGGRETTMPERRADVVVGRALDWLSADRGRFFAWVHVYDPHSPYQPPDEYAAQYRDQPYYGEVAFVDHALGPLLDRLRGLPRPTLVIITADHGESLGEHGEATHGMFAYESTLHVPLIVAAVDPAHPATAPGRILDTPVRHIDIVPTVLDLIGAPTDPSLPGASLRGLIDRGSVDGRPSYFEAMTYNLVRGWAPLRGVLAGHDKYIDLPLPELYDLAADPHEARNLADSRRDRLAVLTNLLRGYSTAPPNRPGAETAEAAAALRSLGYVSGSAPAKAAYTADDDPKRLAPLDQDLHQASDLEQHGHRQEAIALLERVISRRPDTADAYITLAHAHWENGDPARAIGVLERGLAAGAPERDIRIRLGLYLAESHADTRRAIALLKGTSSEDVEGLNGLGVAYADANQYGEAIATFEQVLKLDPTNGLALQNMASMTLREALAARAPAERLRQAA